VLHALLEVLLIERNILCTCLQQAADAGASGALGQEATVTGTCRSADYQQANSPTAGINTPPLASLSHTHTASSPALLRNQLRHLEMETAKLLAAAPAQRELAVAQLWYDNLVGEHMLQPLVVQELKCHSYLNERTCTATCCRACSTSLASSHCGQRQVFQCAVHT
jgi:hypothetical protein